MHETVSVNGQTMALQHPLLHHSYLTLEDYFSKFNHYTTLGAQSLNEKPHQDKRYKVLASFGCQFIKFYVVKLGFLDGYYGFLWCLFSALYPVVKYAKYEELAFESRHVLFPVTAKTEGAR